MCSRSGTTSSQLTNFIFNGRLHGEFQPGLKFRTAHRAEILLRLHGEFQPAGAMFKIGWGNLQESVLQAPVTWTQDFHNLWHCKWAGRLYLKNKHRRSPRHLSFFPALSLAIFFAPTPLSELLEQATGYEPQQSPFFMSLLPFLALAVQKQQ